MKNLMLFLFLLSVTISSCKKSNVSNTDETDNTASGDTSTTTPTEDVYIYGTGYEEGVGLGLGVFKNQKFKRISGYVGSFAVTDNGDIYVADKITGNEIGYWKNNTFVKLDYCFDLPIITSYGNDLYYITRVNNSKYEFGYWKNNVFVKLDGCTETIDIAVNSKGVYVAGKKGAEVGYWLNGNFVQPTDCSHIYTITASVNDIAILGKYGSNWGTECFWINEKRYNYPENCRNIMKLPGQTTLQNTSYHFIAQYGNATLPKGYFKNATTYTEPEGYPVELYQIIAYGNDIYTAGFKERDNNGNKICGYWKNEKNFKALIGCKDIYGIIIKPAKK